MHRKLETVAIRTEWLADTIHQLGVFTAHQCVKSTAEETQTDEARPCGPTISLWQEDKHMDVKQGKAVCSQSRGKVSQNLEMRAKHLDNSEEEGGAQPWSSHPNASYSVTVMRLLASSNPPERASFPTLQPYIYGSHLEIAPVCLDFADLASSMTSSYETPQISTRQLHCSPIHDLYMQGYILITSWSTQNKRDSW